MHLPLPFGESSKLECPKGEDNFMALPTPEEIGELVCKLAASEIVEKEATEEVCRIIKEQSHR